MSRTVYPAYIKKDTKAQGKEAKALLKTLKAESESYKRKQIDGRSIRNYTYKKSQNDKDEGVSDEHEYTREREICRKEKLPRNRGRKR